MSLWNSRNKLSAPKQQGWDRLFDSKNKMEGKKESQVSSNFNIQPSKFHLDYGQGRTLSSSRLNPWSHARFLIWKVSDLQLNSFISLFLSDRILGVQQPFLIFFFFLLFHLSQSDSVSAGISSQEPCEFPVHISRIYSTRQVAPLQKFPEWSHLYSLLLLRQLKDPQFMHLQEPSIKSETLNFELFKALTKVADL